MTESRTAPATTVARLSVEALRSLGVDILFCLPGVQNDDFFDACESLAHPGPSVVVVAIADEPDPWPLMRVRR